MDTTYIYRMDDEYKELKERINKLEQFLNTKASQLDFVEYVLMRNQCAEMKSYADTLRVRIAYAKTKQKT